MEFFEINSVSGEVTTVSKLDREDQAQFEFIVEARDEGNSPLTSSTLIKVIN